MNKKILAELRQRSIEQGLDYDNLVEGLELIKKHSSIVARSANKLLEWQGQNTAPGILGTAILVVLQLSVYEDPEYLTSALESLRDIYAQAMRDNASASELFEVMAQTSLLEKNNNNE